MPLPARLRPQYVQGRCADYEAPTIDHVDYHLRRLSTLLGASTAGRLKNLRHDIDLLLDRRFSLGRPGGG